MNEIERRIYVDDELLKNEYSYLFGEKKDEIVNFVYSNIKTGKESEHKHWNYAEALNLARARARDGRYKNFEFLIFST